MKHVGFTGAHCTGKSTVARMLKESMERPERWLLLTNFVVMIPKEGGTYQVQTRIMDTFLTLENINRRKCREGIIQDRTIYDVYAYSKYLLPERKFNSFVRKYRDVFRKPRYDYVFFFPIRFQCPEKKRNGHWGSEGRKEIQQYILEAFERFGVDYIEVKDKKPENRVRMIRKILEG